MVSTAFKRGWLRRVYRTVPGTYANLSAALNAENDTASAAVASGGGGSVTSVSANGHQIEYAAPDSGSSSHTVTLADSAELSGEMLDRYDSASAALIASGIASPTDAQIYAQMLAELQAAWFSTPDFSNLHFARS